MYDNYKKARDAAWRVLIKYQVRRLPIDIAQICIDEGFTLLPYSRMRDGLKQLGFADHAGQTDGFSLRYQNRLLLFYDDTVSKQRQRFTIGHELGHYLNGDVTAQSTYRNREPSATDDPRETAANVTASRILSPACVLWHLGLTEASDIARACDISQTAAEWRAERLRKLTERDKEFHRKYGHGSFLMSPLERQVYKQFFGTER